MFRGKRATSAALRDLETRNPGPGNRTRRRFLSTPDLKNPGPRTLFPLTAADFCRRSLQIIRASLLRQTTTSTSCVRRLNVTSQLSVPTQATGFHLSFHVNGRNDRCLFCTAGMLYCIFHKYGRHCDMLGRYAYHGPQRRWHPSSPHGLRCPAESFPVLRGSLRAFLTAHGTAAAAAEMTL